MDFDAIIESAICLYLFMYFFFFISSIVERRKSGIIATVRKIVMSKALKWYRVVRQHNFHRFNYSTWTAIIQQHRKLCRTWLWKRVAACKITKQLQSDQQQRRLRIISSTSYHFGDFESTTCIFYNFSCSVVLLVRLPWKKCVHKRNIEKMREKKPLHEINIYFVILLFFLSSFSLQHIFLYAFFLKEFEVEEEIS